MEDWPTLGQDVLRLVRGQPVGQVGQGLAHRDGQGDRQPELVAVVGAEAGVSSSANSPACWSSNSPGFVSRSGSPRPLRTTARKPGSVRCISRKVSRVTSTASRQSRHRRQPLADRLGVAGLVAPLDRLDQAPLVREVPVDAADRDLRPFRDPARRRRVVPALDHLGAGRVQDPLDLPVGPVLGGRPAQRVRPRCRSCRCMVHGHWPPGGQRCQPSRSLVTDCRQIGSPHRRESSRDHVHHGGEQQHAHQQNGGRRPRVRRRSPRPVSPVRRSAPGRPRRPTQRPVTANQLGAPAQPDPA